MAVNPGHHEDDEEEAVNCQYENKICGSYRKWVPEEVTRLRIGFLE